MLENVNRSNARAGLSAPRPGLSPNSGLDVPLKTCKVVCAGDVVYDPGNLRFFDRRMPYCCFQLEMGNPIFLQPRTPA